MVAELNGKACTVSGKNVLRAEKVTTTDAETGETLDLGNVGRVVNVDTEQLKWVLARGEVPVITPAGHGHGRTGVQHQRRHGRLRDRRPASGAEASLPERTCPACCATRRTSHP